MYKTTRRKRAQRKTTRRKSYKKCSKMGGAYPNTPDKNTKELPEELEEKWKLIFANIESIKGLADNKYIKKVINRKLTYGDIKPYVNSEYIDKLKQQLYFLELDYSKLKADCGRA
jgi:hypothetical protein